jgi:hypothetical protein
MSPPNGPIIVIIKSKVNHFSLLALLKKQFIYPEYINKLEAQFHTNLKHELHCWPCLPRQGYCV